MSENGREHVAGTEEQLIAAAAANAVLFLRIGRDGMVLLSGDVITAGDDVRAYGLLEKLRQAVGPICQQRREAAASLVLPPPGLRLT